MLTEKEQWIENELNKWYENTKLPYELRKLLDISRSTIKQLTEAQERELTFTLQLRKENERLKEALRKIAEQNYPYAPITEHSALLLLVGIAIKALKKESEPHA